MLCLNRQYTINKKIQYVFIYFLLKIIVLFITKSSGHKNTQE